MSDKRNRHVYICHACIHAGESCEVVIRSWAKMIDRPCQCLFRGNGKDGAIWRKRGNGAGQKGA